MKIAQKRIVKDGSSEGATTITALGRVNLLHVFYNVLVTHFMKPTVLNTASTSHSFVYWYWLHVLIHKNPWTRLHYTDKDNQGNGWYYDMRMLRVLGSIVISYHNTTKYGGSGYWLVLFPAQPTDGDSSCRNPSPKPLPDAVSQAWSWLFLFLTIATRKMSNSVPTASLQEIQKETDGA